MTGRKDEKKISGGGKGPTRRDFIRTSATAAGAAFAFPAIVPASVFGANAPSERITLGVIGTGRIARSMDIPEFLKLPDMRIVAVCDVDANRVKDAKAQVDGFYAKQAGEGAGKDAGKDAGEGAAGAAGKGCATFGDYRELLGRDNIDAVAICTPDHWHAVPIVAASKAGKDIFVQKPLSLTISGGRIAADAVKRHGRVLQIGSQQRSNRHFRQACELVRNGVIGDLKTVKIGLPGDPGCGEEPEMPVPESLNYDMWLGCTPEAPYTEKRVHPQKGYSRPGWLRIEAYGAGMITGWGTHHVDTAHWGMGMEYGGPLAIEGDAEFPESGLWNVHGDFRLEYTYPGGVRVIAADNKTNEQGVRFEGTEGWIHVKRWKIRASDEKILKWEPGPDAIRLYRSDNHKQNFVDSVRSRALTVAPAEIGHRSCSACLLGSIAMHLKRKLRWDAEKERFIDDDEANGMLSRPMREPWTF